MKVDNFSKKRYSTRRVSEKLMVFGYHAVLEAIREGRVLEKVLVRRDMRSSIGADIAKELSQTGTLVQRVPVEKLDQLTDRNHQGVIAFLSPIEFHPIETIVQNCFEEGKMPFIVVLDGLTDVRNLGAIARTCSCAAVDALVLPNSHSAAVTSDAIKTSSGALLSLPVCRSNNLENTLLYLKNSGLQIIAATEHCTKDYTTCNMNLPLALLLGNEEKGIDPSHLTIATEQVRIPMFGKIESLNVSVAAGIFIYEVVRQRR